MAELKVKIYASPNKGMDGNELKQAMAFRGLSYRQLAKKLGRGWDKNKIRRLAKKSRFYLHPVELQELLNALGATTF